MSEYEVRTIPVEVRALTDETGRVIEGRAIVYNVWSEDLGGFREKLAKGSAKLANDLLALFDHDSSMVLGRTSAGTLEAKDDGAGVVMRAYPPDTSWANDLLVSMDRGDIKHMSFRLRVNDDLWEIGTDGQIERTILDMEVDELSIVSMPAYPQTSASARDKCAEIRAKSDQAPIIPLEDTTDGGAPEVEEPGSGDSVRYELARGKLYRPHKEG
jgi:hypothetical protein